MSPATLNITITITWKGTKLQPVENKDKKSKKSLLLKPLPFVLLAPLTESTKNTKVMCGVQFPIAMSTNEAGDSVNLPRSNLFPSLRADGTT